MQSKKIRKIFILEKNKNSPREKLCAVTKKTPGVENTSYALKMTLFIIYIKKD